MKRSVVIGCICTAAFLRMEGLRAQTVPPPPAYTYDVASVHRSSPNQNGSHIGPGPQGGLRTQGTPVMMLLTFAYRVPDYRIVGAPAWASSEPFDLSFTPDKSEIAPNPGMAASQMEDWQGRQRQRLQAVLRDRFELILHIENREMQLYGLSIVTGGRKLPPWDGKGGPSLSMGGGTITGTGASIGMLADLLSSVLGRPVTNETGLAGQYNFHLEWTPDPTIQTRKPGSSLETAENPAGGPSILTAIREQLGLRLESKKGSAPVYVVDKITRPDGN